MALDEIRLSVVASKKATQHDGETGLMNIVDGHTKIYYRSLAYTMCRVCAQGSSGSVRVLIVHFSWCIDVLSSVVSSTPSRSISLGPIHEFHLICLFRIDCICHHAHQPVSTSVAHVADNNNPQISHRRNLLPTVGLTESIQ